MGSDEYVPLAIGCTGDLWLGDCLDVADEYADGHFQMLVTSTPYPGQRGFNVEGHEYLAWWRERLGAWLPKIDPDTGVVVQNIGPFSRVDGFYDTTIFGLPRMLEGLGLRLVDTYIWDKLNAPPSGHQARYDRNEWEFVFVAARSSDYLFSPVRGAYSPKTVGKSRTGMRQADLAGSMSGGHERLHPEGSRLGNVLRMSSSGDQNRPRVKGGSFPRKLVERFILQHSRPGDWVLDPCVGSGTVPHVALANDRNAVGVDVSEDAITVAAQWTGLPVHRLTDRMPRIVQVLHPPPRSADLSDINAEPVQSGSSESCRG